MVDGEAFVGADADAIAVAALPGSVRIVQVLTTCSVTVSVAATNLPAITAGDHADIVVAVIEDGLRTEVNAGESQGRTLTHATVVHEITTVAEASSPVAVAETRFAIKSDWSRKNVKIVAFVQERASGRVLGTASMALAQQ